MASIDKPSTHPRKVQLDHPLIERLRGICMPLPETYEKEAWGETTFRVQGGTMFAMSSFYHHDDDFIAVHLKAAPGVQEELVAQNPEIFFRPPYTGHNGWLGIKLEGSVDWKMLETLLRDAHLLSAPGRLRKELEAKLRQSFDRKKSASEKKKGKKVAPPKKKATAKKKPATKKKAVAKKGASKKKTSGTKKKSAAKKKTVAKKKKASKKPAKKTAKKTPKKTLKKKNAKKTATKKKGSPTKAKK